MRNSNATELLLAVSMVLPAMDGKFREHLCPVLETKQGQIRRHHPYVLTQNLRCMVGGVDVGFDVLEDLSVRCTFLFDICGVTLIPICDE